MTPRCPIRPVLSTAVEHPSSRVDQRVCELVYATDDDDDDGRRPRGREERLDRIRQTESSTPDVAGEYPIQAARDAAPDERSVRRGRGGDRLSVGTQLVAYVGLREVDGDPAVAEQAVAVRHHRPEELAGGLL